MDQQVYTVTAPTGKRGRQTDVPTLSKAQPSKQVKAGLHQLNAKENLLNGAQLQPSPELDAGTTDLAPTPTVPLARSQSDIARRSPPPSEGLLQTEQSAKDDADATFAFKSQRKQSNFYKVQAPSSSYFLPEEDAGLLSHRPSRAPSVECPRTPQLGSQDASFSLAELRAKVEQQAAQQPPPDPNPKTRFFDVPDAEDYTASRAVSVPYVHAPSAAGLLGTMLARTPKPKGRSDFSSVHVVAVEGWSCGERAALEAEAARLRKPLAVHWLAAAAASGRPVDEYNAVCEAASGVILSGADRASLVVFVGTEDVRMDAFAALVGMLPFRGVQVALVTRRAEYGSLLKFSTPSGAFSIDAEAPARMGMFTLAAVYGPLPDRVFSARVQRWRPVSTSGITSPEVARLPFKVGGLELPMITHNGSYSGALQCLADTLREHYPEGFVPIVSCGETVDALGYGADVLEALGQAGGLYFTHKSGETYKRYDNWASTALFAKVQECRRAGRPAVIVAVGGGVNGNSAGLIAGLTGVDFVEVPTTPMHYNDATTSAKKAFSLVVDDVILSKNIIGCFYLPKLVFCVSEMLLSISSAEVHATVGEAAKTMNMLGVANSPSGAAAWHNILGGSEFASDFTQILRQVAGFETLIGFIADPRVRALKEEALRSGRALAALRCAAPGPGAAMADRYTAADFAEAPAGARQSARELQARRTELMRELRGRFVALPAADQAMAKGFLDTINREVVKAKAMFLAYEDPFEKYRALLFEYAHTLGHGIEAFANRMYCIARDRDLEVPEEAVRLHGQCVGMAVTWAGEMSSRLGLLAGEGLALHQSFVQLFNRHGGFAFRPLRELCERLGITREELCEGVLAVVRRDNKRGYCNCSGTGKSVDQLVTRRPGLMLESQDPAAAVRYLVEVDEALQLQVLRRAWEGDFDRVADLREGALVFVPCSAGPAALAASPDEVSQHIHARVAQMFAEGSVTCLPCSQ